MDTPVKKKRKSPPPRLSVVIERIAALHSAPQVDALIAQALGLVQTLEATTDEVATAGQATALLAVAQRTQGASRADAATAALFLLHHALGGLGRLSRTLRVSAVEERAIYRSGSPAARARFAAAVGTTLLEALDRVRTKVNAAECDALKGLVAAHYFGKQPAALPRS